ncbi:MAG: type II secretion system F family protein, partial [Gammaproteobacteria bacterium]|nr:type II secretion system F family protein [Gammaproteobacteria bacterium]
MADKAIKQDMYTWEGMDRSGKRVKGEMSGSSNALVKSALRRQGVNPLKVKKKATSIFSGGGSKKIVPKDIAIFSRQLATMMSSGVPLVQSFEIVGRGHENPGMQELILNIKGDVEAGNSLADALNKHPHQFDELYVNLVRAGEAAGILEDLLKKIATYKEKTEAIKAKIKKALTYPIAIMVVAFVVTAILMIFVIPQFAEMFSGFGANLPAMTLFVVNLSDIFVEYWYIIFGSVFGAVAAFLQAKKRSRKFNHLMDRIMLQAPVFGDIIRKAVMARFARTLGTMFAAGVPLVEAMESVAGA